MIEKREVEALRHMLGADSQSPGFRNYYNDAPDSELMVGMESKGMVKRGRECPGGSVYWHAAPLWAVLVLGKEPS